MALSYILQQILEVLQWEVVSYPHSSQLNCMLFLKRECEWHISMAITSTCILKSSTVVTSVEKQREPGAKSSLCGGKEWGQGAGVGG